ADGVECLGQLRLGWQLRPHFHRYIMLGFLKVTLGLLMALVQPGEEAQRFICLGPGGGGQMYGTGISPHDPNLMHVSCDMGTFYVSEDGGEHWWMCNQLEMEGITSTRPGYHPI